MCGPTFELSVPFQPKPHTAQEPGSVSACAVIFGSMADSRFGAPGPYVWLPVVKTGSGHDQSHIMVSLASRWRDLLFP